MAQKHVRLGSYTPPPLDDDGYQVAFATTSSSDSNRTMRGYMKNVPLFTVEAYTLKWSDLPVVVASRILHEVMEKDGFDFYHLNIYTATWETRRFYAVNFNAPVASLEEGDERLNELSFQVTSERPVL